MTLVCNGQYPIGRNLGKQPANSLLQEGRLLLAGPRPAIDAADPGPAGYAGCLVVARFDSLQEARAWAEADPYVAARVYEKVDVSPFLRVMPP